MKSCCYFVCLWTSRKVWPAPGEEIWGYVSNAALGKSVMHIYWEAKEEFGACRHCLGKYWKRCGGFMPALLPDLRSLVRHYACITSILWMRKARLRERLTAFQSGSRLWNPQRSKSVWFQRLHSWQFQLLTQEACGIIHEIVTHELGKTPPCSPASGLVPALPLLVPIFDSFLENCSQAVLGSFSDSSALPQGLWIISAWNTLPRGVSMASSSFF